MSAFRKAVAVGMVSIVMAATLFSVEARAAGEGTSAATAESARMGKRLGAGVGIADPYPGLLGVSVAYNIIDMVRADIGYASLTLGNTSTTTIGFGGKALVPGWSLSPVLGLHYAQILYSGDGLRLGGFDEGGGHVYTSVGLDYQSKGGFNGGVGYHFSFRSETGASPYLHLGWFFDLTT